MKRKFGKIGNLGQVIAIHKEKHKENENLKESPSKKNLEEREISGLKGHKKLFKRSVYYVDVSVPQ